MHHPTFIEEDEEGAEDPGLCSVHQIKMKPLFTSLYCPICTEDEEEEITEEAAELLED